LRYIHVALSLKLWPLQRPFILTKDTSKQIVLVVQDDRASTNEAYELTKQAGEGGNQGIGGGGVASGRGGEEGYEYEVVSAHPPAQPVAAGEGIYEHIP